MINSNNLFKIRWCKNTGPYRKLLPLLKEKFNEDCLIITLDDDIEYHPNLIKNLVDDYDRHKCSVNYRGFTMKLDKKTNSIIYWNDYELIKNNLYNFSTNGAGTVFHPSFFHKTKDLIFNEKIYKSICPTSDDIWYNFCRIANNVDCFIDTKQFALNLFHKGRYIVGQL